MRNIAIFASGSGTNCENIINYFADSCEVNIAVVICNKADAKVLERADRLGVDSVVITKRQFADKDYVLSVLSNYGIEVIVLAGFLLMVPDYLIEAYPRRIINLHPALLPKFGGNGMYGHFVHEAVKKAGETETGMTVHYVTNVCDGGEIIAQFSCKLSPSDTVEDIAEKEHQLEMAHFPQVIEQFVSSL